MNFQSLSVRTVLLMFLAVQLASQIYAENTVASTTMPYFGPDQKSCVVNVPKEMAHEDGGYIADENCTKIYILPPKLGVLEHSIPYYSIYTIACDEIQEEIARIVAIDPVTQKQTPGWEAELKNYKDILLGLNPNTLVVLLGDAVKNC